MASLTATPATQQTGKPVPVEHAFWPARTREDRVCGACEGDYPHTYDDHAASRWDDIRCTEPGCSCREFVCVEHPDGECVE